MAHNFKLKAVKTFDGNEGIGFSANLYEGNKKVGTVLDDAWGGPLQIHITDPEAEKRLKKLADEQPLVVCEDMKDPNDPSKPFSYQPDVDHLINDLFVAFLKEKDEKKLKRQCQTKTIFHLKSDGPGIQRVINHPYDEKVKAHIHELHGDDLIEIVNDRFLPDAPAPSEDTDDDCGPSPR